MCKTSIFIFLFPLRMLFHSITCCFLSKPSQRWMTIHRPFSYAAYLVCLSPGSEGPASPLREPWFVTWFLSHRHTANSSVYLSRLQHLSKSLEVEEDVYSQNKTWWRRAASISESRCFVKSPVSPCTAWDWGLMFLHIVTHLLKPLFLHVQKWIAAPAFRVVLGVRTGS